MSRLVYGLRPVLELLRSGRPVSVIYSSGQTGAELRQIHEQARRHGVELEARSRGELDALADGKPHQGVIAVAGDYPYREPLELVAAAGQRQQAPLLVVLDEVQDPQNLGALVRSSDGLGAHGVIVPRHRAAGVTPAVVKASAGATEHLPIALCTNIVRTLEQLKEASLWIVGTSADAGEPPWAVDFTVPTALVLGSEGKGLRPLVARSCDRLVRIPTVGRVASLNVAAAGAMLLYEALRQRSQQ